MCRNAQRRYILPRENFVPQSGSAAAEADTICDLIRNTGRPDDRLADKKKAKGSNQRCRSLTFTVPAPSTKR